jgi:hypothetical protein
VTRPFLSRTSPVLKRTDGATINGSRKPSPKQGSGPIRVSSRALRHKGCVLEHEARRQERGLWALRLSNESRRGNGLLWLLAAFVDFGNSTHGLS